MSSNDTSLDVAGVLAGPGPKRPTERFRVLNGLGDKDKVYTVKNIDKSREDFYKLKSNERVTCKERQTKARDRIISITGA